MLVSLIFVIGFLMVGGVVGGGGILCWKVGVELKVCKNGFGGCLDGFVGVSIGIGCGIVGLL